MAKQNVATAAPKKRRFHMTNKTRKSLVGMSFITPWFVGLLLFTIWPIIQSLYFSFNFIIINNGISTTWKGVEYYGRMFQQTEFLNCLTDYLKQITVYVPVAVVFSLIIAMLINQKIKGKGLFRTIFFLPVIVISGPVIDQLKNMGATELGLSFDFGSGLGFLEDMLSYMFDEIVMILWFSGIPIIIFLAGLQKIDGSMYEAARIDGASGWESFWKITLPNIKPLMLVNMIYIVVSVSTFDSASVVKYIDDTMFSSGAAKGYGYASAVAWVYFILMVLIILIWAALIMVRKKERYASKKSVA